MRRVIRSEQSRADMLEIWLHIAVDNERAADKLIDRINEAILLLAKFPGAGPSREEWGKGIRSFPVGNYVIIYRGYERTIHIVRILHGARDIPATLE